MPRNKHGMFKPHDDAEHAKHAAHADKIAALANDSDSDALKALAREAHARAAQAAHREGKRTEAGEHVLAATPADRGHCVFVDRHFPQAGSVTDGGKK